MNERLSETEPVHNCAAFLKDAIEETRDVFPELAPLWDGGEEKRCAFDRFDWQSRRTLLRQIYR